MRRLILLIVSVSGCHDLTLPQPPGPGTLQGRLVYQLPGQRALLPAAGGTAELLGSSLTAKADSDGRFVLGGLTVKEGSVLVRFDAEGDGRFERQRVLDLRELKAGAGRDVALGEVVLNRNARAGGKVRRGDRQTTGGHGGIFVFVPELSFQTLSGDNGDWVLEDLPEGTLPVAFFTQGYAAEELAVTLTPGSTEKLRDVELVPAANTDAASAAGIVTEATTGAALADVSVHAARIGAPLTASSNAQGEFTFAGLIPGVYQLAFEKAGFETTVLRSVLLTPGPNELPSVSLREGSSVPFDFSADGGSSADGGLDAGAACEGLCSAGFVCASSGACRSPGCEGQSCAWCSMGQCLNPQCGSGPACLPGEVCDNGTCVAVDCVGVACPGGRCVTGGSCLPSRCSTTNCAPGLVCAVGDCVHPRCVGKTCGAGTLCAAGACLPTSGLINPCGAGFVRRDGRCVEAVCEGASCPAGASCRAGACVAEGLFAAGIVGPQGDLNSWESVLAANVNGTWQRLNLDPLPKVRQLAFSIDGSWIFVVGEDDTLRRSQDGVRWQTSWSGTTSSGGAMKSLAVFPDGSLYAAMWGSGTALTRVIKSTDNGGSWSTVTTPIGNFNGYPDVYSVAPPDLFTWFNFSQNARGLQRFDGGILIFGFASPPRLVFDPNGFGPTLLAETSLFFLDAGISGPVSTGIGSVVYSEAPRTFIWAASTQAVWKSPDHGVSWGSRSTAFPLALELTSLVQGVDGTLYAGNRKATPSLLSSTDDGDTWLPAAPELPTIAALSDGYATWAPDASYGFLSSVIPTVPNGFFYQRPSGGPVTSTIEPRWSVDGGVTIDAQGSTWNMRAVLALRVSALGSRSCSVGALRCGGACVDVAADALHCGRCGNVCPGASCVGGTCQTVPQLAALSGCADGTREGLVDLELNPALAACAGTWAGDLTAPGAEALCAAGWHLCRDDDTAPRAVSYSAATGFPGCFAMRASTDDGDGCEPLDCTVANRDDIAGMGGDCAQLSGVSRAPSTVTTVGGCLADKGIIDSQCCSVSVAAPPGCPQRGESGVLCCRGP